MFGDGGIGELGEEIRAPVPLQTGAVESIKGGVEHGEGHLPDAVEVGRERAYRSEELLGLREIARVAPDDATHLLEVQMFGEGGIWGNREKEEESG